MREAKREKLYLQSKVKRKDRATEKKSKEVLPDQYSSADYD